jgi:hypothetical protein
MGLFSIGCRDSGNVLKPVVIILNELKKFRGRSQFYAVDVEMLNGSLGHPIGQLMSQFLNSHGKSPSPGGLSGTEDA